MNKAKQTVAKSPNGHIVTTLWTDRRGREKFTVEMQPTVDGVGVSKHLAEGFVGEGKGVTYDHTMVTFI